MGFAQVVGRTSECAIPSHGSGFADKWHTLGVAGIAGGAASSTAIHMQSHKATTAGA